SLSSSSSTRLQNDLAQLGLLQEHKEIRIREPIAAVKMMKDEKLEKTKTLDEAPDPDATRDLTQRALVLSAASTRTFSVSNQAGNMRGVVPGAAQLSLDRLRETATEFVRASGASEQLASLTQTATEGLASLQGAVVEEYKGKVVRDNRDGFFVDDQDDTRDEEDRSVLYHQLVSQRYLVENGHLVLKRQKPSPTKSRKAQGDPSGEKQGSSTTTAGSSSPRKKRFIAGVDLTSSSDDEDDTEEASDDEDDFDAPSGTPQRISRREAETEATQRELAALLTRGTARDFCLEVDTSSRPSVEVEATISSRSSSSSSLFEGEEHLFRTRLGWNNGRSPGSFGGDTSEHQELLQQVGGSQSSTAPVENLKTSISASATRKATKVCRRAVRGIAGSSARSHYWKLRRVDVSSDVFLDQERTPLRPGGPAFVVNVVENSDLPGGRKDPPTLQAAVEIGTHHHRELLGQNPSSPNLDVENDAAVALRNLLDGKATTDEDKLKGAGRAVDVIDLDADVEDGVEVDLLAGLEVETSRPDASKEADGLLSGDLASVWASVKRQDNHIRMGGSPRALSLAIPASELDSQSSTGGGRRGAASPSSPNDFVDQDYAKSMLALVQQGA
ncbi:unnamed protein product, partial [Amoebophrya sp. A25]